MVQAYINAIQNKEINKITGKPWSIDDVPLTYKKLVSIKINPTLSVPDKYKDIAVQIRKEEK